MKLRLEFASARRELLDLGAALPRCGDLAAEPGPRKLQAIDLEVALLGRLHRAGAHRELADQGDDLRVVEVVETLGRSAQVGDCPLSDIRAEIGLGLELIERRLTKLR